MNIANKITFARFIGTFFLISFLFLIKTFLSGTNLIFNKINIYYFIAGIVFIFLFATDFLDGYIARKYNQITVLGQFLDPVVDKILINSLIIFLCNVHYYQHDPINFPIVCAILIINRDFIIDMLRLVVFKNKNVVISSNIFGKMKTLFEVISIVLILFNGFPFCFFINEKILIYSLVYLATFLSIFSGLIYLKKNWNVLFTEN
jgi:CDP-diacylglycerol--glycerol-3-phosphate 3-phosphatidyltransferase